MNVFPILWNAYPFHPHGNSTPRSADLKVGQTYFQGLVEIFDGFPIVTAGKTAQGLLDRIGMEHVSVPYPNNAQQSRFRERMDLLIAG
jgi:hypothetical protein